MRNSNAVVYIQIMCKKPLPNPPWIVIEDPAAQLNLASVPETFAYRLLAVQLGKPEVYISPLLKSSEILEYVRY